MTSSGIFGACSTYRGLKTGRAPALADIFPCGEKRITLVGPCF
jgi:hypothetical protein